MSNSVRGSLLESSLTQQLLDQEMRRLPFTFKDGDGEVDTQLELELEFFDISRDIIERNQRLKCMVAARLIKGSNKVPQGYGVGKAHVLFGSALASRELEREGASAETLDALKQNTISMLNTVPSE